MRILLSVLFLVGACSFATAGEQHSVVADPTPVQTAVSPPTTSPKVYEVTPPTCQPPVTVRRQRTIMEPVTETVEVEREITEYVPQTRTVVEQQQVTTMVPRVIEEDVVVCPPQQYQWGYYRYQYQHQSHSHGSSYGHNHNAGQHTTGHEYTHSNESLHHAKRALTQLEQSGASGGEIRRARRTVMRLSIRLREFPSTGVHHSGVSR